MNILGGQLLQERGDLDVDDRHDADAREGEVERLPGNLDGHLEAAINVHRDPVLEHPGVIQFSPLLIHGDTQLPPSGNADIIRQPEIPRRHGGTPVPVRPMTCCGAWPE
jgi:hypothetical protein